MSASVGGRVSKVGVEMSREKIEECLVLLRQADDILMAEKELALAAHLSLVIERLAMRLPGYTPNETQQS
jgi:hypothetical protein